MKKVLFSLLIVLVLLWSCGTIFAKGSGKGKAERGQGKRTERIEKKNKGTQADSNEPTGQVKGKRVRQREQQRVGEVSSEGKGKSEDKGKSESEGKVESEGKGKGGGQAKQQIKLQEKDKGKGKGKGKAVEKVAGEGDKEGQAVEKGIGKGKGKGQAVEKDTGQGKGHQQQLKAVEEQILHEEIKHSRWQARLKRIRELAAEEGNTKMVERVDKLLENEQQRYDRKGKLMQERKQQILQLGQKGLSGQVQEAAEKGPDKTKPEAEVQSEGKSENEGMVEKAEE
jgi:hypothetical protein